MGQNFLINDSIAEYIVNIGNISKGDTILEIGPGTGKLTQKIIQKNPKKIIVVEKDMELVSLLKEKFNKKINIINMDILEISEDSSMDDIKKSL